MVTTLQKLVALFLAFSKTLCLNYIEPFLTFMRIYAACSAGIMALKMHSTSGRKKKKSIFHFYLLGTLKAAAVHSTLLPIPSLPFSHAHLPEFLSLPNSLEILPHIQPYLIFILLIHLLSSWFCNLKIPKEKNNTCLEDWKCQGDTAPLVHRTCS